MNRDLCLRRRYISQLDSDYADCVPIAICNALRFLGRRTPRPGTKCWEEVVDVAGCRHGTTISERRVADFLGAKLIRITPKNIAKHVPVLLTVHNPEVGHAYHAVAVLEADTEGCTVVNYRVDDGPLIERVSWGDDPPRRLPKKSRVRRLPNGSTEVTVYFGHLDRRKPWPAIYRPDGADVYKVTISPNPKRNPQ